MRKIRKAANSGNGHKVIPYLVFDCSIEDLKERSDKVMSFPNATAAGNFLGLSHNRVPYYSSKTAIANKTRFYSEKHKKEFAIRVDKKKPF